MRRILGLALVISACAGTAALPTPEEILADGIVTEREFLAALGAVESCVEATGAEFSIDIDPTQDGIVQFRWPEQDGRDVEAVVNVCIGRHLGRVEDVWADQIGPTPEEDAAFYDGVVSCVEEGLGVEFGTVQPRGAGGPDTSVTDAALAADRDLYMACFDLQLARERP